MVSAQHYRRRYLTLPDKIVKYQPGLDPFSQAKPADTTGQPLKCDLLPCLGKPGVQVFIFGKRLNEGLVCYCNIIWVT